jgi:hypothetical protein
MQRPTRTTPRTTRFTARVELLGASDSRHRMLADAQLDAIRALILDSREVRDVR